MVVWGGLTSSWEKKRSKRQRRKGKICPSECSKIYPSEEFQRIARRYKKAFLSEQCKEIEENNRMGKTRDLFTEKARATHSSTLAWKIPWVEEPGMLQSLGSWRVGHDWATSLSLFTLMHWRRKWQPTPVFLPGDSQGRQSLVGCGLWGHTESDTTEVTQQQQQRSFQEN